MKVISILQPWATLAVIGAKKIETRSWNTKYRGDILIHASISRNMGRHKSLHNEFLFKTYNHFAPDLPAFYDLPFGAIIGKASIHCTITTDFIKDCSEAQVPLKEGRGFSKKEWEQELAFGDYSPNRWGWLLRKPVQFKHIIPCKGALGLWDFDEQICLQCGCTEDNCEHCIKETGSPCHWVSENLCSACASKTLA